MSSSGINLEKCRIPLEEIIRATKKFSSETCVGDGGFGTVYRGKLSEDWEKCLVAIKRLDHNGYQGNNEFHNELKLVSSFNHPNIIPFVGYCDDANEKIIVCKYASNRSLDHHLQDPDRRSRLTWEQRLKICLGAARGVKYLHSGVGEHSRVIHRDVKSANILLDDNLEAKICDFGLSRLGPRNQSDSHVRTKLSGTRFYMDPIYNERGMLSKESDIYSFGVVMFEISSGTMAYKERRFEDVTQRYLIDLVRSYYDDHELVNGLEKLIDPTIRDHINMSSFNKFNEIAHECINFDLRKRPTMDRIIKTIGEALNIQSFQVDVDSGEKCYMLGAKELSIAWQDDPRYWEWKHIPESRFSEVCILKAVCWLAIHGKIPSVMLAPETTYVAYLVFQTTNDSRGLSVEAKTTVSFGGRVIETENMYLQRPETTDNRLHALLQENDGFPHLRKDGWMEIKLGEFECKEGEDYEVKMEFDEIKHRHWKTGLIVEGIEVRSKRIDNRGEFWWDVLMKKLIDISIRFVLCS